MRIGCVRFMLVVSWLTATMHVCMADWVTFGSGANQFQMEFVTIGNPGNAADIIPGRSPAGSVGYEYGIGKFEVANVMTYYYNVNFGTTNGLEIPGKGGFPNTPAQDFSWNEAARFVNWLNTSMGYHAAYKFTTSGIFDNISLWTSSDVGYDAANPYRNSFARFVLPSHDEWYKAAYYDPNKTGGGGYWLFPTGSNDLPRRVSSGTDPNTAVYGQNRYSFPAAVDQAGGLSPYGVMGLGGNVYEWTESPIRADYREGMPRIVRGGSWTNNDTYGGMASFEPDSQYPGLNYVPYQGSIGFRVVSLSVVPEPSLPSMMVIGSILWLGRFIAKRRMKKQPAQLGV